jgi:ABC-2 type transport system ATP-binding protein
MENIIVIQNLTKDYGEGKGIFDVSFNIEKGEVLGFVGANGAGKTTTIRHIMGFLKPDQGYVEVKGLEAYKNSAQIKQYIGYIPGEIAFPDLKTGIDFLKSQAEFIGLTDLSYADEIVKQLQLDPKATLKRMSKGMKQKTAIVAALMHDPEILILDEPTTGLDPLMRDRFLTLIENEKAKGKTILISSHLYEELERVCDRVALIDEGKIINITSMSEIKDRTCIDLKVEFNNEEDFKKFKKTKFNIIRIQEQFNQVTVRIEKDSTQSLFEELENYDVKFFSEVKYTLEKHFTKIIMEENKND